MTAIASASVPVSLMGGLKKSNSVKKIQIPSSRRVEAQPFKEVAIDMLSGWLNVPINQANLVDKYAFTRSMSFDKVKQKTTDELFRSLVILSNVKPWASIADSDATESVEGQSLKRFMLEMELKNSTEIEPNSYRLPSGESTLDFFCKDGRITCIFDDSYCHLLSHRNGRMTDMVFEGNDFQSVKVGQYFRSIIEN